MAEVTALENVELERSVIGCALVEEECLYRITPFLKAQDFSIDSHRRIFGVATALADAGKGVDPTTLANALGERRELVEVGGVTYLFSLTENITSGLAKAMNVESYAKKLADLSRRRRLRIAAEALMHEVEDISMSTADCLQNIQSTLLEVEADSIGGTGGWVKEFLPKVAMELEEQAKTEGLIGSPTGIGLLDDITGGVRDGELWTVGALPGRGKTALGVQIVLNAAEAGRKVALFSLEMHESEIGKRLLAARSKTAAINIRNPKYMGKDGYRDIVDTIGRLERLPIFVDDAPSLKLYELIARARLYVRRHGVKLVVVDYLRLIDSPGRDLREKVGNAANALRQFAKTERVGVVLLSQLRRPEGGINAKPNMLELKESGDIEAHSHVVLLLYMPLNKDGRPSGEDEIIIGKNRHGMVGTLPVKFETQKLQFFERTNA